MNIQVGKNKVLPPKMDNTTKEPISNSGSQPFTGIGIFEPIEIPKERISKLITQINGENLKYPYQIKRQEDKYFIV